MKLQFKRQQFQADAAKAVCDVFAGQPFLTPSYMIDRGDATGRRLTLTYGEDFTGFGNARIVPELNENVILEQIRKIQRSRQINPSKQLEGCYNLTVEMETGVGKTYTYIKTMYELNKRYEWSKFIVVAPSVAIREGAYKSFQITEEHFAEDVVGIIDSIYDSRAMQPENARANNVELAIDKGKLDSGEFKALWSKINAKSVYIVEFDEAELISKAVAALNQELRISKIFFKVESGAMTGIESKEKLLSAAIADWNI
jgi:restriction endonuclease